MKKIILRFTLFIAVGASLKANAQSSDSFHLLSVYHIASAGKWDYIAVGPGNNRLYVPHATQVNILNETTGDSVGFIPNTPGVHGVAFDKTLNRGFISNGKANTVTVFDLSTDTIITEIPTGKDPDAILFEPFSGKIITCNGHDNSISIINPLTCKVISFITLSGNPETAVSDEKGRVYINIESKNEIAVINIKNFTLETYWSLAPGEAPAGLAIDRENNRLFSGCADTKSLVIVDATKGHIITTLPIGAHCDAVAFDSTTKNTFASCGDGTLIVIKEMTPNKFGVIAKIMTKKGARTIAVDQHTHRAYLPTADFEPLSPTAPVATKPTMIPGTFQVLVVGEQ